MKVQNMTSERTGREVPNQFIITDNQGNEYFQSYQTVIVKRGNGETLLDKEAYNYSRTTIKYRNIFLGEDSKTVERKIKSGEYKLVDLNG